MRIAAYRRAIAFASALAAYTALPPAAWAADPAQLGCILGAVSESERVALSVSVAAQRPDHAAEAPFGRAVAQCRQAHGWSAADTQNAALFAVSAVGLSEIRRQLAALGVETTELEAAVLSDGRLMEELGTGMTSGTLTTDFAERFAERHDALIARLTSARPSRREVAELIGSFAALRGMMEIGRHRFTAN